MTEGKLDPRLLALLEAQTTTNPPAAAEGRGLRELSSPIAGRETIARRGGAPAPPTTAVRVFVEADRVPRLPLDAIAATQVAGNLWTATVPLGAVRQLVARPAVRRLTLARRLRPLLDVALPRVHVPAFRARGSLTGANVIVGVIDTGLDASHAAFAGRVLRVWDQRRPGPGVPEGRYGIELAGGALSRSRDTDGHGTHVAGIAAGAHQTFGGVAPGASIVAVRTTMDDTDIADAVRYVFRIAGERNVPAVVNLSLGGHDDAHDGTDLLCRVIDEASGPGRIVCCAAGNEGDDDIHGTTKVRRAREAAMRFRVPAGSVGEASLTGWYPPASRLEIAVRTPDGKVTPYQPVIEGAPPTRRYELAGTHIIVTTPGPDPANGDLNFRVTLRSQSPVRSLRQGVWQLRARLASGPPAVLHAWTLDDAGSPQVTFTGSSRSDAMKIGSPGSASRAVTVAAFTTKIAWTDADGTPVELGYAPGRITSSSSEGPLRTGARKPDVTAPGTALASARSRLSEPDREDLLSDDIVMMSGTSMASPIVAGVVALLLERAPALTPERAQRLLRAASRIPGRRAGTFDVKWGYGLLDAARL